MTRKERRQRDLEAVKKRKQKQRELREEQKAEGLDVSTQTISNSKSKYETVADEKAARQETTTEHIRVILSKWPILLRRLTKIKDFRNPKKVKYQLSLLMVYSMLSFVYHMSSRREANKKMTRPMFMENLRLFFPELEDLPHHDTVERVLAGIEVEEIEKAHIALVRRLIAKKKFYRFLIDGFYPIAIDGTQKLVRRDCIDERWLQRKAGTDAHGEQRYQYYVYVLEASLAFSNGMVIPIFSEFLDYTEGDTALDKQDCEQKALPRLAARLKREFKRLRIMVLYDGLGANGPAMDIFRKNNWDYMIVLKDGSLPSVWEEYEVLHKHEPRFTMTWGNRRQTFRWANDIEYRYGNNHHKRMTVHVVVCQEAWEEVDPDIADTVTKTSRHAWLSKKKLNKREIHERCNLAARHRWGIEEGFLVEKHHGYQYEHCFSYNWNAMRGYHYLMHLGLLFNVLAAHTTALAKVVRTMGVRGFISFVWETMAAPWLEPKYVLQRLEAHFQLRLD